MAGSMSKDTPRDMKIVNLEVLQINRKCTINIFVEKDGAVSSGEVMQAIGERGWIEATKMLQQTSRNCFKRSVATYTDATSILSQINEDHLEVSGYGTILPHVYIFFTISQKSRDKVGILSKK